MMFETAGVVGLPSGVARRSKRFVTGVLGSFVDVANITRRGGVFSMVNLCTLRTRPLILNNSRALDKEGTI